MVNLITEGGVPEETVEEAIEEAISSATGLDELAVTSLHNIFYTIPFCLYVADTCETSCSEQLESKVMKAKELEEGMEEKVEDAVEAAVEDMIVAGADPEQAEAQGAELEKEILQSASLKDIVRNVDRGEDDEDAEREAVLAAVDQVEVEDAIEEAAAEELAEQAEELQEEEEEASLSLEVFSSSSYPKRPALVLPLTMLSCFALVHVLRTK